MSNKERYQEITDTCASIAEDLRQLQREAIDLEVKIDLSEVYYKLGYIEGMCEIEGQDKIGGEE
jgi:hypothetical protein